MVWIWCGCCFDSWWACLLVGWLVVSGFFASCGLRICLCGVDAGAVIILVVWGGCGFDLLVLLGPISWIVSALVGLV